MKITDKISAYLKEEENDMQKIHDKIKEFFKKNPSPSDEQVHKYAEEIGIEHDELEKHIYMMLGARLKNEGKINEIVEVNPSLLKELSPKQANLQMLRFSIIAELDATNIYEQFADITDNEKIRQVMLDVANEEKVHVGEFEKLMQEIDPDYERLEREGEEEIKDI